jgi:hypothetical protein
MDSVYLDDVPTYSVDGTVAFPSTIFDALNGGPLQQAA